MKRILISLALVAASSAAFAGGVAAGVTSVTAGTPYAVCDGTGSGGKTPVWGGDGQKIADPTKAVFTQQGFTIQCSANVFLNIQEASANLAGVASASGKGNQAFSGTSNGGAIAAGATCSATSGGCVLSDVSNALSSALTAATSTGGAGTSTTP
jgi:hypothetical protein